MSHIEFNIGNACNMKCKYCMSIHTKGNLDDKADKNEIIKKIISYKKKGYKSLGFVGGEPTIFPELPEYLKIANVSGYSNMHIVTNGIRLAKRDYFEKLLKNGLTEIKASIHSVEDETESNITQVPRAFSKKKDFLANNLFLRKKYNFRVDVQVVINRLNYDKLTEIAKELFKYKINSLRFQFIGYYDDYPFEYLKEMFINYYSLIRELKKLKRRMKRNNINSINVGDIPLCFLLNQNIITTEKSFFVGESSDYIDEIDDGRNKEKFNFIERKRNFLKEYPLEKCSSCELLYKCPGFYKGYFKYLEKLGFSDRNIRE